MKKKSFCLLLVAIGLLGLTGCDFDVPATAGPTRPVEQKLLGNWVTLDPDDHKELAMHLRALDEFNYAVSIEDDIYRAFHSDVAKLPLVSVQDLNTADRKYVLFTWRFADGGAKLILHRIATTVIPDKTKDTATLQELLSAHAKDPRLLGPELVFTRRVQK